MLAWDVVKKSQRLELAKPDRRNIPPILAKIQLPCISCTSLDCPKPNASLFTVAVTFTLIDPMAGVYFQNLMFDVR